MEHDDPKEQPLRCEIVDGRIVISVGINTLAGAPADREPWVVYDMADDRNDFYRKLRVTDPEEFAQDVARALEREEEDGTNDLHRLFDKAMIDAVEDGSGAVEECDEPWREPPTGGTDDAK
jgi:hypothetical protein